MQLTAFTTLAVLVFATLANALHVELPAQGSQIEGGAAAAYPENPLMDRASEGAADRNDRCLGLGDRCYPGAEELCCEGLRCRPAEHEHLCFPE
ncbi:hypothetical protein B0H16DRAFT_1896309 [Mycena metata]|uniref:Uncharacterized protein n=1 Tax=Mycena metata TaxID=1033252 RepID=A0AAD7HJE2_9AGAR|nr:hypothetical protein B0H16DRAFT_1896309 [Mycena metata]